MLLICLRVLVVTSAGPGFLSVLSASRELLLVVLVLTILLPWGSAELHFFLKIKLLATLHYLLSFLELQEKLRLISELEKLRHLICHEIDVVLTVWAHPQKLGHLPN